MKSHVDSNNNFVHVINTCYAVIRMKKKTESEWGEAFILAKQQTLTCFFNVL